MGNHKYPSVVIVGRTNVGKSTLFNRLSTKVKSITLDQEGVTRDAIKDHVTWNDRLFELVDTGGITVKKSLQNITEQVRQRVLEVINHATVILFVVDGSAGLHPEDVALARIVRKSGNNTILIINKSDRSDASEKQEEFDELGFKEVIFLSAQHGRGTAELLEKVTSLLPMVKAQDKKEERQARVVLLGKPNVGKSSLMNLLMKQERSIVHDAPGTTREAITESVAFNRAVIELTDTAGIRRKRTIDDSLEKLMVKSSFNAVEQADIVMLLVDSSQGELSDQELKLALYAFDQKKALMILFNKHDLMDTEKQRTLTMALSYHDDVINHIPTLYISCKTGKNVTKILPLTMEMWHRYMMIFDEDELNLVCKRALVEKPLYHKGNMLRLYHVKQLKTGPISLVLFVNSPDWFGKSQLRYLENVLRAKYQLDGIPIAFFVRKRG